MHLIIAYHPIIILLFLFIYYFFIIIFFVMQFGLAETAHNAFQYTTGLYECDIVCISIWGSHGMNLNSIMFQVYPRFPHISY